MKYVSIALACGLLLSACGGSDEGSNAVPPSPALEGLWQATSVDDVNDNLGSFSIPAGEIFMAMSNANANPFDATFYSSNATLNCLDREQGELTHIGNNRYRDGAGDIATMVVNGNTLSMTFSDSGQTLKMNMSKTTALSEGDLSVCGVQNDSDNLILSDDTSVGFIELLFTEVER